MPDTIVTIQNIPVLKCAPDGEKLASEAAAVDLIGQAMEAGAEVVLVPVERLDPVFFQLRSGLAGQIVQKFVTYRRKLIVLGDITEYVAASRAFHDFVYEANKGKQIWFIANLEELNAWNMTQ